MYAEIDGSDIKLYGTIWNGDGQYIVSQIQKLLKAKAPLTIHLHTPGGSVFDGNLIYNAIAASKADITIQIDGLAASMGAILMLAGKTVKIAENAFIMIHAPSGSADGNAADFENTAKLLRNIEANFTKKLEAKTKATPDVVQKWMTGDNWFSADEALQAGLVDAVIEPVIEDNYDLSAFQDLEMRASLFSKIENKGISPVITNTNQNQSEMSKLNIDTFKSLGLGENATEQEISAAVDALNKKNAELLKAQSDALKARAKKLVTDAVAQGKILGSEADAYEADANANYELTERLLAKLPSKDSLSNRQKQESTVVEGREKWTFDDWRKKDPKGLIEMKSKEPEAYAQLLSNK